MALVDDLAAEAVAAGNNKGQRLREFAVRGRQYAKAFAQTAAGISYDDALLELWQELSRVMARRQVARQQAEAAALQAAAATVTAAVNAADVE
jgi:phage terminase Nu1 subunit (DNA packaging protein)